MANSPFAFLLREEEQVQAQRKSVLEKKDEIIEEDYFVLDLRFKRPQKEVYAHPASLPKVSLAGRKVFSGLFLI